MQENSYITRTFVLLANDQKYLVQIRHKGSVILVDSITVYDPEASTASYEMIEQDNKSIKVTLICYRNAQGEYHCRCGNIYFVMNKGKNQILRPISESAYVKYIKNIETHNVRIGLLITQFDASNAFEKPEFEAMEGGNELGNNKGFQRVRQQLQEIKS